MKLGLEIKVGIFVVATLLLVGVMTVMVGQFSLGPSGYEVRIDMPDAFGLTKDANVKFRGVDIGKVRDMVLENGHVTAVLSIEEKYIVPNNVALMVRSSGFLGEKYAELSEVSDIPATGDLRSAKAIGGIKESVDFDQLQNAIWDVASDLKKITGALSDTIASEEGKENIRMTLGNFRSLTGRIDELLMRNEYRVDAIIENIQVLSESLRDMSKSNEAKVAAIIENIKEISSGLRKDTPVIAENLKRITGNVDEIVTDGKDDVKASLANIKTLTDKFQRTVDNLNAITDNIEQGKGTLGMLVSDNETATDVKKAIKGLRNMVGKLDEYKLYVSFSGERNLSEENSKGYFKLKLVPNKDKYYVFGLNNMPYGSTKTTRTYYRQDPGPGDTAGNTIEYNALKRENKDGGLGFSVQFGHKFKNLFGTRVGLFENEFGVAGELYPLRNDNLTLALEAFDFPNKGEDRKAQLKAKAEYFITPNIFLNAGYNDMLNPETRSAFVGGGVQFLDQDLMFLLGKVPMPTGN